MNCVDCEYCVGDYDETTDCYQTTCPYVDYEPIEMPDYWYEEREEERKCNMWVD